MKAGPRNRLVTFQRGTVTTDDYGGEATVWATLTTAWVEVLHGTGQERREAAQEAGSITATFIALWTPTLAGLGVKDRISAFDATWDIVSIAPVGLNRELHITAVRSV